MNKRRLGDSGLEIAPLALGGNVFGWTADEATSFAVLDAFVDAGFNFVDTADIYSSWAPGNHGGESETIIGKWLKRSGKRQRVFVATKVGLEMGPGKAGLSKAYIKQAAEDSLKRLQTDYIDLYQAHKDDPNTPLEETLGAFAELIKEGKVTAIGASNYSAERLDEALKVSGQNGWPRYESLQPEYNLYNRAGFETKLQPLCRQAGLGVIPYYSLASGFLTGKYRSEKDLGNKARAPKVKSYLNPRGLRILDALDEIAKQYHAKPAQIALAWLAAQPTIVAPIASATSVEQLHELTKAVGLELDSQAIERLNQASAGEKSNEATA
ncbi:MAG TPA: aldo/keto reductase [Bryobacteraceae bacterium]|nr:aldo/keto reductase [Bryobacteraceae bacterium]